MQTISDIRTVLIEIDVEDSEPLDNYTGTTKFQPKIGEVRVDSNGIVRYVKVEGPVLTAGGKMHATSTKDWIWSIVQWSDARWPEPMHSGPVPAVALQLVQHVLQQEI